MKRAQRASKSKLKEGGGGRSERVNAVEADDGRRSELGAEGGVRSEKASTASGADRESDVHSLHWRRAVGGEASSRRKRVCEAGERSEKRGRWALKAAMGSEADLWWKLSGFAPVLLD